MTRPHTTGSSPHSAMYTYRIFHRRSAWTIRYVCMALCVVIAAHTATANSEVSGFPGYSGFFGSSGYSGPSGPKAKEPSAPEADSIMARVYRLADSIGSRLTPFRSTVYVRHTRQTQRRNILTRLTPGMQRIRRGRHRYLCERAFRFDYRPDRLIDAKEVAQSGIMPAIPTADALYQGHYTLSIYTPNLFTDRILSPFHRRTRAFYHFALRTRRTENGRRIAVITIRPHLSNAQLVSGEADIDERTGRVVRFALRYAYGWSTYHVSAEMGADDATMALPHRVTLASRLNYIGNLVDDALETVSTYDTSPLPTLPADTLRPRHDLTARSLLRTDTTGIIRSRQWFDAHRPYPLLPHQEAAYRTEGEVKSDSLPALARSTEALLFDSHHLRMGRRTEMHLPAIITPSMVQWSGSKGVSLQTRLSLTCNLADDRALTVAPRLAYNFKEKQIYWRIPTSLAFWPHMDARLTLEIGGGDKMYNSAQADEVRHHLSGSSHYDTLRYIFDHFGFQYYRDNRLNLSLSLTPLPGLTLQPGLRLHHRTLMGWNALSAATGMNRRLGSIAPRLRVEWTPGQYYYTAGHRRIPLYSRWPTFMADAEYGLSTVSAPTGYTRLEGGATYRLPLFALRSLFFRVGAGVYTRREKNCFLDYDYFRYSYLPTGWNDELSGQFQLLDSHWYNEARSYVLTTTAYESPMLLVSRLPFLTRAVRTERLYVNLLHLSTLGYYTEWGYGIATPLLDAAAFVAFAGSRQSGLGVKFVFHLFDY